MPPLLPHRERYTRWNREVSDENRSLRIPAAFVLQTRNKIAGIFSRFSTAFSERDLAGLQEKDSYITPYLQLIKK
jgi:hypothetical protein